MKLIRFIKRGGFYDKVCDSFINPIIKYLPKDSYQIITANYNQNNGQWENECLDNSFDITFFTDVSYKHDFFISHGIADKLYREEIDVRNFKFIGVSGQLWVDKYIAQGVNIDRIKIVGYTKLDELFQKSNKTIKEKTDKICVLYAPTHNVNSNIRINNTVSSYPRLMDYFNNIPEDIEIKYSYHPANKENNNTTFDLYKWADVLISDTSSTIYEALALDIPVVFPDFLVKEAIIQGYPNSFEYKIYNEQIGYHARNINEFWDKIREAKQNGLDVKTRTFIESIFSTELRGNSGKVTAEILMKLANQ